LACPHSLLHSSPAFALGFFVCFVSPSILPGASPPKGKGRRDAFEPIRVERAPRLIPSLLSWMSRMNSILFLAVPRAADRRVTSTASQANASLALLTATISETWRLVVPKAAPQGAIAAAVRHPRARIANGSAA
jgi:hypothetical protein